MKKLLSIFIFGVPLLIITSCNDSVTKELESASYEINQSCPQSIDEYTTLIGTIVVGKSMTYNYHIDVEKILRELESLSMSRSDWLNNQVVVLTNYYCTEPNLEFVRNSDVVLKWNYMDLDGSYFEEIEVHPNDCQLVQNEIITPDDGPYTIYYENGEIQQEGYYKNGLLDGSVVIYYETGQVNEEQIYREGLLNGPFVMYYEGGEIQQEGHYKDDKADGNWKLYYQSGELEQEHVYELGIRLSIKCWNENGLEFECE